MKNKVDVNHLLNLYFLDKEELLSLVSKIKKESKGSYILPTGNFFADTPENVSQSLLNYLQFVANHVYCNFTNKRVVLSPEATYELICDHAEKIGSLLCEKGQDLDLKNDRNLLDLAKKVPFSERKSR